jgi:hypothetical protein
MAGNVGNPDDPAMTATQRSGETFTNDWDADQHDLDPTGTIGVR